MTTPKADSLWYERPAFTALWAAEYSAAHGWRWIKQRDCARESAQDWLTCYQEDEPGTAYRISDTRPTEPPEAAKPR